MNMESPPCSSQQSFLFIFFTPPIVVAPLSSALICARLNFSERVEIRFALPAPSEKKRKKKRKQTGAAGIDGIVVFDAPPRPDWAECGQLTQSYTVSCHSHSCRVQLCGSPSWQSPGKLLMSFWLWNPVVFRLSRAPSARAPKE